VLIAIGRFIGPFEAKPTRPALWADCSAVIKLRSFSAILTLGLIVFDGGKPLRIAIVVFSLS
jgi:hypothetical protein